MDISLQGVRRESSLTYKGESKRDALSILLRYAARTRNGLVQYQAMEKTNKGRHSSKASWRSLVSACVSFLQNVLNSIPTLQLHRLEDLIILKTASQGVLAPLFWLHAPPPRSCDSQKQMQNSIFWQRPPLCGYQGAEFHGLAGETCCAFLTALIM